SDEGYGYALNRDDGIDVFNDIDLRVFGLFLDVVVDEAGEIGEFFGHHRKAARHGVTAAIDDQARVFGVYEGLGDVNAGDGAPGAAPFESAFGDFGVGDDAGGFAVFVFELAGDKAAEAGVPVFVPDDDGGVGVQPFSFDFIDGLFFHL